MILNEIIKFISEVSGGNEMIAGALTLSASTSLMYIVRGLPQTLWRFLKRNTTTSMTFNNGSYEGEKVFYMINNILQENMSERWTRTLSIHCMYKDGRPLSFIGIGYGMHIMWHNKTFMWMNLHQLDSSGGDKQKEELTIYTFGRSHEPFKELLRVSVPSNKGSEVNFSEYGENGWRTKCTIPKRGMDTLVLNPETRELFLNEVSYFIDNKDAYTKIGLNHKMTTVLHGIPGSGKTSLVRALAGEFGMNICNLNLSSMNDEKFMDAIAVLPKNSILLIEDFDSCSATKSRKTEDTEEETVDEKVASFMCSMSLSGILNALDGVVSLDDTIVFLTTNHLEQISSALLREGRVDQIIELPKVRGEEVVKHLNKLYDVDLDVELIDMDAKSINKVIYATKDKTHLLPGNLKEFEVKTEAV